MGGKLSKCCSMVPRHVRINEHILGARALLQLHVYVWLQRPQRSRGTPMAAMAAMV